MKIIEGDNIECLLSEKQVDLWQWALGRVEMTAPLAVKML